LIYLDYNATTPIDERVAQAMLPYIYGSYGNPSSTHGLGITSKNAVEDARAQVADLINCDPKEILFTSGGSESNNTAIKGVAYAFKGKGNHIITSKIEHPSVLRPCNYLENLGCEISLLPVDKFCMIDPEDVRKLITERTILITVMHSNNETGTIQQIKEISNIAKEHNILIHTDASQSIGKVPIDVKDLDVDFLTIAGHKLYAPKGIGALYIRNGIKIEPLIHGAGHEGGRRAGTENVIFDVALGKACELSRKMLQDSNIKEMTEYFYKKLNGKFKNLIHLNGHPDKKLPNTLNISFVGYDGHDILDKAYNIAASTGSACHSGTTAMSPVLKAMGVSDDIGRGAVRFSLGRYTTIEEIDKVVEDLFEIIENYDQ
jgi:cysteine desulfurase